MGPTSYELPVIILDAIFILYIYSGMLKLRTDLTATGQAAKLRMYAQLMNVILANMMAWCAFVFLFLFVQ